MALVVEGGYDLQALAASLDAVIETLSAPASAHPARWPASNIASTRGQASVDAVRTTLAPFWTL
jgi:acetoin utilization deacetylase AcuC-like enzyme